MYKKRKNQPMKNNILENHEKEIAGIISVNDRIVIRGTLPIVSYSQGMNSFLFRNSIRIFDYLKFASGLRDNYIDYVKNFATENNIPIKPLNSYKIFKEDEVQKFLEERGTHPGLVCIISVVEGCSMFEPRYDKINNKPYLHYKRGRCLHYYFYFIDGVFGLCYLRVPTYAPFGLQFYCNGHNVLANELDKAGIKYHMLKNSFDRIDDYEKAQELANNLDVADLKKRLDYYSKLYCPVHIKLAEHYHWSVMQLEYATDIIFKKKESLEAIYSDIVETAVHSVKVENIATFLGRRFTKAFNEEAGTKNKVLIEGTCIKHFYGRNSIKMYDKFGLVLRIETTSNDVRKFTIFRPVHHRDGTVEMKQTAASKDIFYMNDVNEKMHDANKRYIEYISGFEEHSIGREKLNKVTEKVVENNRSYRGLNFFNKEDENILKTIMLGEFNISGFRNKDIRQKIKTKSQGQISRIIKSLRIHGVIKKVAKKYKYYVTENGKDILLSIFRMKELYIIPSLS